MTEDKALGMDADISRRDFINGTAIAVGALAAGSLGGSALAAVAGDPSYPPAKMGMRGAHPGSFEYAHLLRDGQLAVKDVADTGEVYDCVIVGAGMSGLAAAHFFLKSAGPSARVLILDNHDDFGGHARRNEFTVDGKSVVINAGTQSIESPERYNRWARQVLEDIGVDIQRYEVANEANSKLYDNLGLNQGTFFDKETWKRDRLVVPAKPGYDSGRLLGEKLPLSAAAMADFARLMTDNKTDYLSGKSIEEKKLFLATTSLKDYYEKTIGVDSQVTWLFKTVGYNNYCVGPDAIPALFG
ncbi:MAG: NAD(P)-binding protein, partial [Sphingomonadaceae bacterium]|nr:NAD(P)-binding protein [Sphingomonadaceae bacterium]